MGRNVAFWHNPDLRLAAPQGPLTITFRTLGAEGMRLGLPGFTGLYGALGFFAFCGRRGQALPIWAIRPNCSHADMNIANLSFVAGELRRAPARIWPRGED